MLQIVNIRKEVGGQTILDDVNLRIAEGEFFSLLGPSGCGKTTLLRCLAGLDSPTSGEILLDGVRVDGLPAQRRPFNMVFQKYALFPHLSVVENIAFGLRLKGLPEKEIRERSDRMLDLVGLKSLAGRRPETLSGGQQQRVAVARALVNEPKVLLLDEPLSALDQKMREHMQTELRALQKRLGLTFIYVTHDQDEAMALSDRIGVMNGGRLEQVSSPRDLYDRPTTSFAAQFVGQMTRFMGRLERIEGDVLFVRLGDDSLVAGRLRDSTRVPKAGAVLEAFVRPERIRLLAADEPRAEGRNRLRGVLSQSIFKGDQVEVHVQAGTLGPLKAVLGGTHVPESGGSVQLCFSPEDTVFFGTAEGVAAEDSPE